MAQVLRGCPIRIVVGQAELEKVVTKNSLVMHDEADLIWIDEGNQLVEARYIIGLSATTAKNDSGNEAAWLKHIGVRVFDGRMPSLKDIVVEKVPSYAEWFEQRASATQNALIVYAALTDVPDIIATAMSKGYTDIHHNCEDLAVISAVRRRVLIVDHDHWHLMRGIDYRNVGYWIHLLICHPFPNQRAYE